MTFAPGNFLRSVSRVISQSVTSSSMIVMARPSVFREESLMDAIIRCREGELIRLSRIQSHFSDRTVPESQPLRAQDLQFHDIFSRSVRYICGGHETSNAPPLFCRECHHGVRDSGRVLLFDDTSGIAL